MTEIRRLVLFFRPYSAQPVLGITAAVLVAVAWLYVPRYMGYQIDTVIRTGNFAVLNRAALIALRVYSLRSALPYVQFTFPAFVGDRLVADLRRQIFHQVQR